MKYPLSYVPLLPVVVAIIAGILIAEAGLWAWIAGAIVCFSFGIIARGSGGATMAVSLIIGIVAANVALPDKIDYPLENDSQIDIGRVKRTDLNGAYSHYDVRLYNLPSKPTCRLTVASSDAHLEIGDEIAFNARLSTPVNDSIPDASDYVTYLRRQGISLTAFSSGGIVVVKKRPTLRTYAERARNRIRSAIFGTNLNPSTIEFLTAVLLGDDSLLDDSVRATFSSTGLAHVLALSGLHVGIIALILSFLLYPLRIFGHRLTSALIIIILLWVYAFVTGLPASVVRAVIMATCLIVGRILQRHRSAFNSLLFAALILLIFNPMSVYSAGFQMSFASVAAILIFADKINFVSTRRRRLRDFAGLFCVSIAAMLGTGMISMTYFHIFPVLFLVTNVIVTPLLPLLIGLGIAVVAFAAVGLDLSWLNAVVDWLYSAVLSIAETIQKVPFASITNIYFPTWVLIPYFLAVAALALLVYRRRAVYAYASVALIAFAIAATALSKPSYPEAEVLLSNEKRYTNVIYRHGSNAYLISTALDADRIAVRDRCFRRYRDYFGKRGCDSLEIVGEQFEADGLVRNADLFSAIGKNYVLVNSDSINVGGVNHIDYAIICRHFKGNPRKVCDALQPDSVLLSRDVNRRLVKRYADSLAIIGTPYRLL